MLISLVLGLIWLKSVATKVAVGNFPGGLSATLEKFASQNPFPHYKEFLQEIAIPNSAVFGYLVVAGEFLASIAILIPTALILLKKESRVLLIILALGLSGGLFLNLNFGIAAGWTSPSTEGLNLLMFFIELISLSSVLADLRGPKKGPTDGP